MAIWNWRPKLHARRPRPVSDRHSSADGDCKSRLSLTSVRIMQAACQPDAIRHNMCHLVIERSALRYSLKESGYIVFPHASLQGRTLEAEPGSGAVWSPDLTPWSPSIPAGFDRARRHPASLSRDGVHRNWGGPVNKLRHGYVEFRPVAENHGQFDNVLQLANIARPIVSRERLQCLSGMLSIFRPMRRECFWTK